MSAALRTIEPTSLTAGDSIKWLKSLSDYPASQGWVLSYVFVGKAGKFTFSAAASVDDHLVDVTASTSLGWVPGVYSWQAYVSKDSERYTVGNGQLTVNQNLSAVASGTDTRSHAKRVLDAIEAILEGTATTDQQDITIAGDRLIRRSVKDLLALRTYYRKEYRAELRSLKSSKFGRTIKVRL